MSNYICSRSLFFRWVNDCKWICEHSLTKCVLSNQKPASDLPVPPTVYWHPSPVALLHGYFCNVGWENILFFVTFHGIICSHILNWTAVIVFSEWRIFLHSLCDHCLFSLQVSASSLRTPPTQYVECWISKCGCNSTVMFSVCNSYFSMLLSHPSTSAPWKTALSVCLCCWPQQSKIIISSTQLFSVLHILTRTHNMLAALLLLLLIANAVGSPHVRGSDSFLFPAVSQMWWCQHTPRTAGPVCSSLFTSPSNSTSSWTWYGSHC